MKKMLMALCVVLNTFVYAQTGEKNFIDQNYIEVTGTAELEIVPDEIYLQILIHEDELKGNTKIDDVEKQMIETLTNLGLDVKNNLKIIDLSGNLKNYFIKSDAFYRTKEYELKVADAETAGKVFLALEPLQISSISVSRVDHSELEKYRQEVKVDAVKAAHDKAGMLAQAIGQEAGRAIYIREIDGGNILRFESIQQERLMVSNIVRSLPGVESQYKAPNIEFEPISLRYSILVRFELK